MNYDVATILKEWKKETNYDEIIQFKYLYSTGILKIFTIYPEHLIGQTENYIDKYSEIFKNKVSGFYKIKFEEIDSFVV